MSHHGARIASQRPGEMHVNGQGKKIRDIDLNAVLRGVEDTEALALVRSLDLSYNTIATVRGLDCLTSLTSLDLAHNRITTIQSLPPTITRLNLSHNELTSEAISQSRLLVKLPLLRELDISHNRVGSLARLVPSDDDHGGIPPCNLQYLRADSNRIATLDGIHLLGASLRILSLEGNYISSLSDVRNLKVCLLLQAASFERCPVTEANRYRDAVVDSCPSLVTLDGTPLSSAPPRQMQQHNVNPPIPSSDHQGDGSMHHRSSANVSGRMVDRQNHSALDESHLQDEGPLRNSASKVHALNKLNKELRLTVQHQSDTNTFLERDNEMLKRQLSEARRVISEQLDKMAVLESQRDAARGDARAYAIQLDRAGAQLEHSRYHAEVEKRKMQEDQERQRVRGLFEGQLESYLSGRSVRPRSASGARSSTRGSAPSTTMPQQPTRMKRSKNALSVAPAARRGSIDTNPPDSESSDVATLILRQKASLRHNSSFSTDTHHSPHNRSSSSAAGANLADQLKKWVHQEVEEQISTHQQ